MIENLNSGSHESEQMLPSPDAMQFEVELTSGHKIGYAEDPIGLQQAEVANGTQAIDPVPIGSLSIGKLRMPIVGRITNEQMDGKDFTRKDEVDIAIVDMRGYQQVISGYKKATFGPYTYPTKAKYDHPGQSASPYALVDLRAMQQEKPGSKIRHLQPISQNPETTTKLSSGISTEDQFSDGTSVATSTAGNVLLSVDDSKRIVIQGGFLSKYKLTTASDVHSDYRPTYSEAEAYKRQIREEAAAQIGAAAMRGNNGLLGEGARGGRPDKNPLDDLLNSIFAKIVSGSKLVETSAQPPAPYEADINERVNAMQREGLSSNKIRAKLARDYASDRGGSEGAMSYVNAKIDGLAKKPESK